MRTEMIESPPSPREQGRQGMDLARDWRRSVLSPQSSVLDVAVLFVILAYTLALVPGLTRWPPLVNDEGREANLFWVASGVDPTAERMNAHRGFATWGTGGLQGASAAIIFQLAGVGVFQARLTSLLWGGALLIVVYLAGRLYWNRAVGLAATALLAVSDPFLVSSHTLRPDIQVATLVIGALLLAELAVSPGRSGRWALLAGILLGLSVDTHLNTLAFIPLVGMVFPLRQGWPGFLQRPEGLLFVAGLGLAAAYYLAVRVLPDPTGFIAGMSYWLGVDKAPPLARPALGLAGVLRNELARYQDYFGEEPLELGLVLLGLGAGLWSAARGSHPARLMMLGLAAAFVFFLVAVSMKSKYYMVLTYPFYMLLVARLIERVARGVGARLAVPVRAQQAAPLQSRVAQHLALVLLVGLAALYPLKAGDRAWENYIRARRYREGQEYAMLTAQLDRLAGPGAKILAPPVYWIGLRTHPYIDIYVYERLERRYHMTVSQFLAETRPDFVITDAKIATEKPIEKLLYNELDARATREFVVRHKNYGDVAVYRLHW